MESPPPPLHDLESEVMECVWKHGEASVRAVMDVLNETAPKSRAYTTYMTIMGRLYAKGMLDRRREGKTDHYSPRFTRDDYMALRARAEVRQLVEQYGDVALSSFAAEMAGIDPARRKALERLAREA
jgi:predicted transcriptional regulator